MTKSTTAREPCLACDRQRKHLGLCNKHYERWRRWRKIYPGPEEFARAIREGRLIHCKGCQRNFNAQKGVEYCPNCAALRDTEDRTMQRRNFTIDDETFEILGRIADIIRPEGGKPSKSEAIRVSARNELSRRMRRMHS